MQSSQSADIGHFICAVHIAHFLPQEQFELRAVDTQPDYDAMTDAEIMILRIFKAPKEVIHRNPNLKMILRWGASSCATPAA